MKAVAVSLLLILVGVVLLSLNTGAVQGWDPQIFYELRIPRTLSAIFVGGGLAVAGVLLQASTNNPLAEPFTLGIAAAAALGAVIGIAWLPSTSLGFFAPGMAAFVSAILSIGVLGTLVKGRFESATEILLTGAILGFFYSSAAMLVLVASEPSAWTRATGWLFGSLGTPPLAQTLAASLTIFIVSFLGWLHWKGLDLLASEPATAESLGVDVRGLRKRIFIIVAVVTAVCVATSGIIGFIGLLVPSILRRMNFQSHRHLIPVSFLLGAAVLLAADIVARMVFRPSELPVGIVLALIGAPFFVARVRFSR